MASLVRGSGCRPSLVSAPVSPPAWVLTPGETLPSMARSLSPIRLTVMDLSTASSAHTRCRPILSKSPLVRDSLCKGHTSLLGAMRYSCLSLCKHSGKIARSSGTGIHEVLDLWASVHCGQPYAAEAEGAWAFASTVMKSWVIWQELLSRKSIERSQSMIPFCAISVIGRWPLLVMYLIEPRQFQN